MPIPITKTNKNSIQKQRQWNKKTTPNGKLSHHDYYYDNDNDEKDLL